jgi:hypothetical protein
VSARPPGPVPAPDTLRNAAAAGLITGLYALLAGGIFRLVPVAPGGRILAAWLLGYLKAAAIFLASGALVWIADRLLCGRLPGTAARIPQLLCLLTAAGAAPSLVAAPDLAGLTGAASFLGAAIALSAADGFYEGLHRALLPRERVRVFLAARPHVARKVAARLPKDAGLLALLPWLLAVVAYLAGPPLLRPLFVGYLLVLAFLAHHVLRRLVEELMVWLFLHVLRRGNLALAAALPVRPGRLTEEIHAAEPDLEAPWAAFLAAADEGLEPEGGHGAAPLQPVERRRLRRAYLDAYGSGGEPWRQPDGDVSATGLVGRLVSRGIRFRLEVERAPAVEPLSLPEWRDLWRAAWRPGKHATEEDGPPPGAWEAVAARCPGEPVGRAVARLYPMPIRTALLPAALAWIPLLLLTLAGIERGVWVWPLIAAGTSLALLLWLTFYYGNWVFDESLRRRDFAYLARQLAGGVMRGELEDALGSRSRLVRARAVELLLFDDDIARLGVTVPPAGLRKYLRRVE